MIFLVKIMNNLSEKKITGAEQNSHTPNCDIYWLVEENI